MADKKDAVLKAFDHARAEIIERLKMRDTALLTHVTASLTFGAAYFGYFAKNVTIDTIQFLVPLTLLFPLLSVVFAQIVSQHTGVIEQLANFIRTKLDPFMVENDLKTPHWDMHTNEGSAPVQKSKTKLTFWKHMLVLHVPTIALSICSIIAISLSTQEILCAFWLIGDGCFSAAAHKVIGSTALRIFFGGIVAAAVLYALAIGITWTSFAERRRSVAMRAKVAPVAPVGASVEVVPQNSSEVTKPETPTQKIEGKTDNSGVPG
jgi:hypothetical protein